MHTTKDVYLLLIDTKYAHYLCTVLMHVYTVLLLILLVLIIYIITIHSIYSYVVGISSVY